MRHVHKIKKEKVKAHKAKKVAARKAKSGKDTKKK